MLATINSKVHENYYIRETFPMYITYETIHFNLGCDMENLDVNM